MKTSRKSAPSVIGNESGTGRSLECGVPLRRQRAGRCLCVAVARDGRARIDARARCRAACRRARAQPRDKDWHRHRPRDARRDDSPEVPTGTRRLTERLFTPHVGATGRVTHRAKAPVRVRVGRKNRHAVGHRLLEPADRMPQQRRARGVGRREQRYVRHDRRDSHAGACRNPPVRANGLAMKHGDAPMPRRDAAHGALEQDGLVHRPQCIARCSSVISNCPGAYSDISVRTGRPCARAAAYSSSNSGDMSSSRPSPYASMRMRCWPESWPLEGRRAPVGPRSSR